MPVREPMSIAAPPTTTAAMAQIQRNLCNEPPMRYGCRHYSARDASCLPSSPASTAKARSRQAKSPVSDSGTMARTRYFSVHSPKSSQKRQAAIEVAMACDPEPDAELIREQMESVALDPREHALSQTSTTAGTGSSSATVVRNLTGRCFDMGCRTRLTKWSRRAHQSEPTKCASGNSPTRNRCVDLSFRLNN